MFRRWHAAVLAILAVFALACEGAGGAGRPAGGKPAGGRPKPAPPSSIAALGDSITTGFASCPTVVACGRNSWSTGNGTVESHYRRILRENSRIRDRRRNFAVPGARAALLPVQAAATVRAKAEYVTILIGANDACRPTVREMTEPAAFRANVDAALALLDRGLPRARILIASVPDLYRLWEVGHDDNRAVRAWAARDICPSLLANPRSTAAEDNRRRRAVSRRVDAYNRELAAACRAYGRKCRYDEGATHRIRFTLALVSQRDYFHPNVRGQRTLAEVTYPRRWW